MALYSARIWLDGVLGGVGAALMTPPICVLLAILAARRPLPPAARPALPAGVALGLGAGLYALGAALAAETRDAWLLAGAGLPWLAYGLLGLHGGPAAAVRYGFPIAFSAFALPWELFLRELDLPLQIASARLAVFGLELAGYPLRFWNAYTFYDDDFYLIVNETCSGMNMLMTLTMYTLVFGWATLRGLVPRTLLWLAALPIALLANGLRVAVIWLLGKHGGEALAMGPWHAGSAYLLFLPVFLALYLVAVGLRRAFPTPPLAKPEAAT